MPLQIDAFNKIIEITSPDTSVDLQALHDFVEDYMASPEGMANDSGDTSFLGDILKPEGKIEDPSQPGVFSQIILLLNSEWQIQFWGGSGYTRIYGGKLVGGVSDQPIKATGTAGDITVLEAPVDGLTIQSDVSGLTAGESAILTAISNMSMDLWQFKGCDPSNPAIRGGDGVTNETLTVDGKLLTITPDDITRT